jgi:hypothetical protein
MLTLNTSRLGPPILNGFLSLRREDCSERIASYAKIAEQLVCECMM